MFQFRAGEQFTRNPSHAATRPSPQRPGTAGGHIVSFVAFTVCGSYILRVNYVFACVSLVCKVFISCNAFVTCALRYVCC